MAKIVYKRVHTFSSSLGRSPGSNEITIEVENPDPEVAIDEVRQAIDKWEGKKTKEK